MKHFFCLLILLSFISCRNLNSDKATAENILLIKVTENNSTEVSDILERIEIIPLETDSISVLDPCRRVRYYGDKDLLVLNPVQRDS